MKFNWLIPAKLRATIAALKAKNLDGRTITLAPTLDDNLKIIGGIRTTDKIIVDITLISSQEPDQVPKQKPATLKISSQEPLILISWIEENGKVGGNVGFWK